MLVTILTLAFLLLGGAKAQQQPSQDEGRFTVEYMLIQDWRWYQCVYIIYDYRQAGL